MVVAEGIPLQRTVLDLDGAAVPLWRAVQLERFVDAEELLRGESPAEPPYWMHLWPGAVALARRVLADPTIGIGVRVLELGAGLGLPAVTAARRGARVVATDWQRTPLQVLRHSLGENGVPGACVQMDWTRPALRAVFDLCLGADVAYDRAAEAPLAATLAGMVRPGGRIWLADSVNTARTGLADGLAAAGFAVQVSETREEEEGRSVWVRMIAAQRP